MCARAPRVYAMLSDQGSDTGFWGAPDVHHEERHGGGEDKHDGLPAGAAFRRRQRQQRGKLLVLGQHRADDLACRSGVGRGVGGHGALMALTALTALMGTDGTDGTDGHGALRTRGLALTRDESPQGFSNQRITNGS